MENQERGQLFAEFWLRCGRCEREASLDARKRRVAVEEARERGWRKRGEHGWVCPRCQSVVGRGSSGAAPLATPGVPPAE